MLKINLGILCYIFAIAQILAQSFKIDSSKLYVKKALTFEEANIVTSYYHQNGIHSGVTGGIGSEKLTDVANVIDLKLSKYNGKGIKTTFGAEIGIDFYTSASSDMIDTKVSSASSSDVRVYPSFNIRRENEITGVAIGGNIAFSNEFDYRSYGGGINFAKTSHDKNTEFSARANIFLDTYDQYLPTEFRSSTTGTNDKRGFGGSLPRNTFDLSFGLSRILTKRFQMSITMDLDYQEGLLSTPFHRVYFKDGSIQRELLPDNRIKTPIGVRANYFLTERIILRSFYRYYKDNWGMESHTINIETPIKIIPSFSIAPYFRYYQQSAIDYFKPFAEHEIGTSFYSSDYDLSSFNSKFYGIGFRYLPLKMVGNHLAISQIELRSSLYKRSDGLSAGIIAIHFQVKGI